VAALCPFWHVSFFVRQHATIFPWPVRAPVSFTDPTTSARRRGSCDYAIRSGDARHGGVPAQWIYRERARPGYATQAIVKGPTTSHKVQWGKVKTWIQSAGVPNEQAMKTRLRELLRG